MRSWARTDFGVDSDPARPDARYGTSHPPFGRTSAVPLDNVYVTINDVSVNTRRPAA